MRNVAVKIPGTRQKIYATTVLLWSLVAVVLYVAPALDRTDLKVPEHGAENTKTDIPKLTSAHRDKYWKYDQDHGVYLQNSKPTIWIYWEGHHKPNYLRMCLDTISCHNSNDFNVRVVNDSEFSQLVDFVHPAYKYLKLNHRSDYFRGVMLHLFGGIYLDADTLQLSDMSDLYEKLRDFDAVGCTVPYFHEVLSTSDMGPFRAGSAFTESFVSAAHVVLDKHLEALKRHAIDSRYVYPVDWTELSGNIPRLMKELTTSKRMKYYPLDGPSTWLQIAWPYGSCASAWLTPTDIKHTHLLTLNNKFMPWEYKHLNNQSVLHQPFILSKLLRQSLDSCRAKGTLS